MPTPPLTALYQSLFVPRSRRRVVTDMCMDYGLEPETADMLYEQYVTRRRLLSNPVPGVDLNWDDFRATFPDTMLADQQHDGSWCVRVPGTVSWYDGLTMHQFDVDLGNRTLVRSRTIA